MSSGSSTSSIRQFGLYRTIDARTEEFLRLSRKRQLRQGCICAAISTAITVFVVIIIILIYEYSNVTNAHNIKPNWLGLMNQSDPLQLDPSHKTKFKLDRTTIQILPLLLKAFTKNKYIDPDVEDSSSPSPNPKDEDTTEKMHKNIFADTRNWMKMPTSRVYAIEFKTSPIVYFKNPTRNLDYFRKVRKIRDYERVMNYVDKMINDKVTSGSTQPMVRTDYKIYEKSKFSETATIPMIKWQTTKPKSKKINNEYLIEPEKQINCSCSSNISLLIRKLIMSLQKIMPDVVNTKVESVKNCTTHSHTVNTVLESNNHKVNTKINRHLLKTNRQNETKTQVPYAYLKSDLEKLQKSSKKSSKNDIAINNMLRLLKPNVTYNKNKNINHNLHNYELFEKKQSTRVENRIKLEKLPKSNDNINFNKSNFERNQSYNSIDHSSNKYNIFENISESTASSFVIDDYYEDYTQADTNDISNIFDILDTHTLELVKNNIISTKSHRYVKKTTPNDQNTFTIKPPQYDFKDHKRNVSDERYVIAMNSLEGNRHMSHISLLNFNKTTTVKNTEFYSIEEPTTHIIKTKYIPTIKLENNINELHEDTNRDEVLERENDKLEEEMEKSTNEESTEEDFKQMENIINNFKYDNSRSSKRQKTEPTNSSELYYWEVIKIQEHAKNISKAILSKTRPTYLEMQRNNWKQEETNNIVEYDANINNYIFE